MTHWYQRELKLPPERRGFHLITSRIVQAVPEIAQIEIGLLHLLLMHTSASLALNENADPDVRADLERWISETVSETFPFEHTAEGPDDMPAHIKGALFGPALSLPVRHGKLCLGTWQGIYLGEHRDEGGSRRLVLTLTGMGREGVTPSP